MLCLLISVIGDCFYNKIPVVKQWSNMIMNNKWAMKGTAKNYQLRKIN